MREFIGIVINAANIATNDVDITNNAANIASNDADIQSNADDIECLYYNSLSDAKRNRGHSVYTSHAEPYCDTGVSGDWKGYGWYRFVLPAGTQMADSDPGGKIYLKNPKICIKMHSIITFFSAGNGHYCGTAASGWLNGAHPTTLGENVIRTVCFSYDGNSCWQSTNVEIKMCSGFYLYKFKNTPACEYKYCGQ